jgi:hypothetical protein
MCCPATAADSGAGSRRGSSQAAWGPTAAAPNALGWGRASHTQPAMADETLVTAEEIIIPCVASCYPCLQPSYSLHVVAAPCGPALPRRDARLLRCSLRLCPAAAVLRCSLLCPA